jgi:hypothetical protein
MDELLKFLKLRLKQSLIERKLGFKRQDCVLKFPTTT